jgi:two-component system NarL family sensor kinase
MEKTSGDIIGAIIIASIILVIIAVFSLLFFLLYIKKKTTLHQQNENMKIAFQQELLQTQIEIQEETFAYISEEIHDNIGQVLSFLKLNLTVDASHSKEELREKIEGSQEIVTQVIKDVRALSKSLSYEYLKQFGLVETIKYEIERIKQTGLYETNINVFGVPFSFPDQHNLLIFRIFQECLNNIIKHANATEIDINIVYYDQHAELMIKDNGIGFDQNLDLKTDGAGLNNMKKRARLLSAEVEIAAEPGKGTRINLSIPC